MLRILPCGLPPETPRALLSQVFVCVVSSVLWGDISVCFCSSVGLQPIVSGPEMKPVRNYPPQSGCIFAATWCRFYRATVYMKHLHICPSNTLLDSSLSVRRSHRTSQSNISCQYVDLPPAPSAP